ncbi:MAG: FecR domain-containing protein, partial [Deltaproteobacteria bacterium]|nr:FecR domain-containing protein [Deltaproteobacteria bacterium]
MQKHRPMRPPADFAQAIVARAKHEGILPASDDEASSKTTIFPWWRRKNIGFAVAASALLLLGSQLHIPASLSSHASKRAQLQLGNRGVFVAEAHAVVDADVDWLGNALVFQKLGKVLYRVEKGRSFEVQTPDGTIFVTGTTFTVDVKNTPTSSAHFSRTRSKTRSKTHTKRRSKTQTKTSSKTPAQTQ